MKLFAQRHSHGRIRTLLPTPYSLLPLLFVICLSSCSNLFQEKISSSGKNDSLDNLFRKQEEITKLQTPQQLYAADYYSSTEIRLTWAGVRGAAYYMVERATASLPDSQNPGYKPDDSDYEVLERSVYGTSYSDVILKNASLDAPENKNRYFYRVSAFNKIRKYDESDTTEPVSAMLFNAPANLKASGGDWEEYIELRWDKTEGAKFYEIWRSDFSNGVSATSLGTVPGNQTWFQNRVGPAEQGKDFYYMVLAQNSFGNKTPLTKPAYGYARVFGAPGAPVVSRAENSGRGQSATEIKIKWAAVSGSDVFYAVYRYSSVDSSLTRLTDKTTATEWPDSTALNPGVYYFYKVQAIVLDAAGKPLKSQFSSSDKTESYILSPPDTVVAVKNPDGNVTVKWEPAIGSLDERSSYKYNVYAYKDINGNSEVKVASSIGHNVGAEGFISADGLNVSSGTFFKVSTVNLSGVESAKSIVVSPAPAAAVIQGATEREYFQGFQGTENINGVYPVKITWKKPDNEEPAFYQVQRSTKPGSGFSTINGDPLGADGPWISGVYSYNYSTGVYTYTDNNDTAKVGRKFYYRVLSLNELKQGSFFSSEVIGYGALTHEQFILEYNKTMGAALKRLTYMYKSGSTDKLGKETKYGALGGSIYYDASLTGLSGARIIIQLTKYAEFYIENDPAKGVYFILNGNSNTSANTSANGSMDGTVTCTGMYPGSVSYNGIEIKGGSAAGGSYGVTPLNGGYKSIPYTILN